MLEFYTVSFFGHRDFNRHLELEDRLQTLLRDLIKTKEYVDFLVGRNGEFDRFISSNIRRAKKEYDDSNSSHILVLPYATAEYLNNEKSFNDYYDEIEVCYDASVAHFKSAIGIRNRQMVDRSDLVICYIEENRGGAYETVEYARKAGKKVINLAK